MTRKYHNHTLQTKPRHREEETLNTIMVSKGNTSNATSSLFPSEMIAQNETTPITAKQNKDHTEKMGATIINNGWTATEPERKDEVAFLQVLQIQNPFQQIDSQYLENIQVQFYMKAATTINFQRNAYHSVYIFAAFIICSCIKNIIVSIHAKQPSLRMTIFSTFWQVGVCQQNCTNIQIYLCVFCTILEL